MNLSTTNITRSIIDFTKRPKQSAIVIIFVAITSMMFTIFISGFLNNNGNLTVLSQGNLKTIGVEIYWDSIGKNKTETINWNDVWLGETKNITIYIQSISNYKVSLDLNCTNWNPKIISEHSTLSWDYNGKAINPKEIVKVELTLLINNELELIQYINNNEINTFDLDILIATSIANNIEN